MARNNCSGGTDPDRIAGGASEAGEAKQPAQIRRNGAAVRYIYVAGALAAIALLIMLAAV